MKSDASFKIWHKFFSLPRAATTPREGEIFEKLRYKKSIMPMGIAASSILKEELSGDLASWIDCASAHEFSSSSFNFSQKYFLQFLRFLSVQIPDGKSSSRALQIWS